MKLNKRIIGIGLVAVAVVGLAACARGRRGGSAADSKVRAAIVTDSAGVDDKSFNQSAWEGLQAWGKANKLEKDSGYNYFQSGSESDFATNLSSAQSQGYNLIFGVGFALHDAVADAAKEHMGLTTWADAPDGKIKKSDVVIAKNYLSDTEMGQLERMVTA